MSDRGTGESTAGVRLDRWLWAARFFRTRARAKAAVEGGKVSVNGRRSKPAKEISPGARLTIRRGDEEFDVRVVALSEQRGPASVASTLFEETPESIEGREAERSRRRMERAGLRIPDRRPGKRDRRAIARLREQPDDADASP